MLDWTLHLLNHAWIPWAALGFLLFWGGGHWLSMQRNFTLPLYRQVREARHRLEETPEEPVAFAARYLDVEQQLGKFRLVLPAWLAYSKTFIAFSKGFPLQSGREPSCFFNAEFLMGPDEVRYYYQTVPNYLLGVGILFTLVGLAAAIRFAIEGMETGDLYATQEALHGLLNAASLKFLSSIAGAVVAMFFSWEEKRQRHFVGREAEQICQILSDRILFVDDGLVGHRQLQETQTQSQHLREISDRLNQAMTQPTFQSIGNKPAGGALKNVVLERLALRFDETMTQLQNTVLSLEKTIKTSASSSSAAAPSVPSVSSAPSPLPLPDLQPLLSQMQQEWERLLCSHESSMAQLLEGINRQFSGLHAERTLAALNSEERTGLLDHFAARMEGVMAHLGGAGLSPFQNLAEQIERAVTALETRATDEPGGAIRSLEQIVQQLTHALSVPGERSHSLVDIHTQTQTHLLEQVSAQIAQLVDVLASQAKSHFSADDLQPLLVGVQQDSERLIEANRAAMGELIESMNRQFVRVTTEASLAELMPDERTTIMDQLAARMEHLFSSLGDASLSPFHRIATQLEKAVSSLEERATTAGAAWDMQPLLLALREEGGRILAANEGIIEKLRHEFSRQGGGGGGTTSSTSFSNDHVALLEQVASQTERAITVLGEKIESSSLQSGLESLMEGVRHEGAQLVRANEEAMGRMLEMISQRFSATTATATLAELQPEERSGLLDRVATRMEQAVVSLGEVGLSPFFEGVRREMSQLPGLDQRSSADLLTEMLPRIVFQLDGVVAALESRVWAADVAPDMTPLVESVRREGERLLSFNRHAMDQLFSELTQKMQVSSFDAVGGDQTALLTHIAAQLEGLARALTDNMTAPASASLDWDALFDRIHHEGASLVQANEAAIRRLLEEVTQRFSADTATTAPAEWQPGASVQGLDGVAVRMEQAVAGLGERGLSPSFEGMRREMGLLIQDNQRAVSQLLGDIARHNREQGAEEAGRLERTLSQLADAVMLMGEKLRASDDPHATRALSYGDLETVQREESARLHESHQQMVTHMEGLLERVLQERAVDAPPMDWEGFFVRVQHEGERLLQRHETTMSGFLGEVTRHFSGVTATAVLSELQPGERTELLGGVALRMEQAVASLGELGLTPFFEGMRREMGQLLQANQQAISWLMEDVMQYNRDRATADLQNLECAASQVAHAITQVGEKLTASVQDVASHLPDGLTEAIQKEGTRLQEGQRQMLAQWDHLLGHALVENAVPMAEASPLPDLERLFARIQREVAYLMQNNEAVLGQWLQELVRRFPELMVTTSLSEYPVGEGLGSPDDVAPHMRQAETRWDNQDLSFFFEGMRQDVGRLLQTNQQAVSRLMEDIMQYKDVQHLEAIISQMADAITSMGEKLTDSVQNAASTLRNVAPGTADDVIETIQKEGVRLGDNQEKSLAQRDNLSDHELADTSLPVSLPTGELVAVLDEESIQSLVGHWRQEGERLVTASEVAMERMERMLKEAEQNLSPRRAEELTLLKQLSTQLKDVVQGGHAPSVESVEPSEESALQPVAASQPEEVGVLPPEEGRVPSSVSNATWVPVLAEMTRMMTQQRNEEMRLLDKVTTEMNRSVASLDAKMAQEVKLLNLETLVNTVHEQGDRLFANSEKILQQLQAGAVDLSPDLAEITQAMVQQRGEEMRLLEQVTTEVNRSVTALDAKIGRATPLELKTLVRTIQDQGDRMFAGSQEILRELSTTREILQAGGRMTESAPLPTQDPSTSGTEEVGPGVVEEPSSSAKFFALPAVSERTEKAQEVASHAPLSVSDRVREAASSSGRSALPVPASRSGGKEGPVSSPWVAMDAAFDSPEIDSAEEVELAHVSESLPALVGRSPTEVGHAENSSREEWQHLLAPEPPVNNKTTPWGAQEADSTASEEVATLPVVSDGLFTLLARRSPDGRDVPVLDQRQEPKWVLSSPQRWNPFLTEGAHPEVRESASEVLPWRTSEEEVLLSPSEDMVLPTVSEEFPKLLASQSSRKRVAGRSSHVAPKTEHALCLATKDSTQQHTFVPALVLDYRNKRERPRQAFTAFIDKQTADFLDSQEQFHISRPS